MAQLDLLAAAGFEQVPPSSLLAVAGDCDSRLAATGDGRFAVLSRLLVALDTWWSEVGAVPTALASQIDACLTHELAGVLDAPSAEAGTKLAIALETNVLRQTHPSSEWVSRGYVRMAGPQVDG